MSELERQCVHVCISVVCRNFEDNIIMWPWYWTGYLYITESVTSRCMCSYIVQYTCTLRQVMSFAVSYQAIN